jgi:diacylglycerol kinase (ATP)
MATPTLLLVNPRAGRVDDAAIGAVCRSVPSDVPLEVAVTAHEDLVPGVLRRLDGRRLLIMGGDGTLNVAIGALHRRGSLGGTTVGFVPVGSANAFARALEIPLDPVGAVAQALNGSPCAVDLFVSDDDHVAVNDLHTGLGVPATHLSRRLKPLLRQLTYPVANSLVGLRSDGWAITVAVDGTPLVSEGERVLAVAVGNSELLGDGTPMWPGASADDGIADVVVLMAVDRRQRIGLALALKDGRHLGRPDVRNARGSEIVFGGDLPGHNADGELSSEPSRRWRVRPGAWCLVR